MAHPNTIAGIIETVNLSQIKEPHFVARTKMDKDALEELTEDIRLNGLINLITLKKSGKMYEVVAGHRRFTAIKRLKWQRVDAMVIKGTDLEAELIKLSENLKRDDLTDIEEALFYKKLQELGLKTHKMIAKKAGKSESYVTQKLSILKYPDCLYQAIAEKKISFSAARELVRITDPIVLRDYVGHAVESGCTPAVAKKWADDWIKMQKYNKGEANAAGDNEDAVEPDRVKVPCFVCGRHFLVENTIMIRVCKKDLQLIKEAMKISGGDDDE
jgi:ParB/RepB/Spo0J family partition protein